MSLTGNTSVHPIRVFPGHFYCMRGPSLVELTGDGNRAKKRALLEIWDVMERSMMAPWGGTLQLRGLLPSSGRDGDIRLDFYETPEGFELIAELPGVDKEDIAVEVDNDSRKITITAERKPFVGVDSSNGDTGHNHQRRRYHYSERYYGKMARSIRLAEMIDVSRAGAAYIDGVLVISFLKRQSLPGSSTRILLRNDTSCGPLTITEGADGHHSTAMPATTPVPPEELPTVETSPETSDPSSLPEEDAQS